MLRCALLAAFGFVALSLASLNATAEDKDSKKTLKKFDVEGMVEIREGDALKVKDLEKASVIMLYMLPEFMEKLEPQAKKLKPGTRIVAHDFAFPNWKPDVTVDFQGPARVHHLYMWTVPERKVEEKK